MKKEKKYDMSKSTKKSQELFSWFYNPFALYLAGLVAKYTNFRPNQISVMSAFAALIAAISLGFSGFSTNPYLYRMVGAFFVLVSYTLDHIDGKVARAKGLSTKFGKWFDLAIGYIFIPLMFFGLAFGLRSLLAIFLFCLVLFSYLYAQLMLHVYKANSEKDIEKENIVLVKEKWYRYWYGMSLFSPVIIITSLINIPILTLWFFGIFGTLYWMAILYFQAKALRRLDKFS